MSSEIPRLRASHAQPLLPRPRWPGAPCDIWHGPAMRRATDAGSGHEAGGWQPDRRRGNARHHRGTLRRCSSNTNCSKLSIHESTSGAHQRFRQARRGRLRRELARSASNCCRPAAPPKLLRDAGLAVTDVPDYTGFPGDARRPRQDAASRKVRTGGILGAATRARSHHGWPMRFPPSTWWW